MNSFEIQNLWHVDDFRSRCAWTIALCLPGLLFCEWAVAAGWANSATEVCFYYPLLRQTVGHWPGLITLAAGSGLLLLFWIDSADHPGGDVCLRPHLSVRRGWSLSFGLSLLYGLIPAAVLLLCALPTASVAGAASVHSLTASQFTFSEMSANWSALAVSLGAGIHEELIFRGLLLGGLALLLRKIGGLSDRSALLLAAVASSLMFAAAHEIPPAASSVAVCALSLYRALGGLYLCGICWQAGLPCAIGAHIWFDLAVLSLAG